MHGSACNNCLSVASQNHVITLMTIRVDTWTWVSFMDDLEDNELSENRITAWFSTPPFLYRIRSHTLACRPHSAWAITQGSIAGQVTFGCLTFLPSREFHWYISNSISAYCKLLQWWIRANMAVRLTEYRERDRQLFVSPSVGVF